MFCRFDIDQRPIVVDMAIKLGQQRSWMHIVRTILVLFVSVAVAVLPAAASFAGAPQMAAASVSMPDCDHHHMHGPAGKTQKSDSNCISMAGCVLHCFSFTGIAAAAVAFVPVIGATLQPLRASDHLSPQLGSLPFRPPRV